MSGAAQTAWKQRQLDAGNCVHCGKPAADGKQLCEGHANMQNARQRRVRSERRAERGASMRASYCHSCGAQRADGRCPFCEG